MTAATEPSPRIVTLDFLRGVAVMGILAMNIIGFAMPFQAYGNPAAYGGATGADFWAWALAFIFIDGKMRAIFSILFGASMLLVIERAEAAGGDGGKAHIRRMLWLLLFGLAHFVLIWWGDILTGYAVVGLLAYLFTAKSQRQLIKASVLFFAVGFLIYALIFMSPLALQAAASTPGADPQLATQWAELKAQMGAPTAAMISDDLARHRGGYWQLVEYRLFGNYSILLWGVGMFAAETLALMLLGMWGLKSGFLTGQWDRGRYARMAVIYLAISIPTYALLAYGIASSGFDVGVTLALNNAVAPLVRPIMALGYVALILMIVKQGVLGAIGTRIAAAGRAAFTNYLGTSIVATFIFYGWGLGLYGQLSRAQCYLVVLGICALMLLWSKPWLDRYRYGPFEWLWRSLSRGRIEPMRKQIAAAA